jgi:hypothetical protein
MGGNPLGLYDGKNPNGIWTLYLMDGVGGEEQSTLVDWSLDITAVPEPGRAQCGPIHPPVHGKPLVPYRPAHGP